MTAEARTEPGAILITLESLMAPRSDPPTPLDDVHIALRRISYVGRPVVIAGRSLHGRELPGPDPEREAWVRGALGRGGYRVVLGDGPASDPHRSPAVDRWRALQVEHGAGWLVSDRTADVVPARDAGLHVILIAPADVQRPGLRPTHRARDLRDAVGHLLVADVFADRSANTTGDARSRNA